MERLGGVVIGKEIKSRCRLLKEVNVRPEQLNYGLVPFLCRPP